MTVIDRRNLLGAAAAILAAPAVRAQAWPEGRTITLLVPFPPGGGTDVVARVVADRLAAALKCRFVVENRPGGGGSIGYLAAIRAPADGSTMLLTSSAIATMPYLYPSKGYDPLRDLTPISEVGITPSLICVGPSVAATSLKDFIAEAKAKPGAFTYASAGIGSGLHLAAELFNKMAGIEVRHVPYKGAQLAVGDLLGGRIDMIADALPSVRALVQDGKLKALGITTPKRSPLAPDVPPVGETVPGYDYSAWFGLFLPAKAPAGMAERVQAALAEVVAQKDFQDRVAVLGIETIGSPPAAFRSFMEADLARWQKVIKDLGISADG
ncbi:Bug family tripartite tricarboxylate transporter substrate binding protein [Enterovirga rhinocerotis]|uniref:Tripartite-type tricarboxylate transporter receptor subunit TctC n=1 Tax=Enterovirga rhinocerotis TaxID=1339210 RepID=A0A4R7BTH4_9HYPH|nr:tripartite tricarboxylate transporter substrate binding protein [Enterovirga rhinocerotis]TDR87306.1 tripartite-type tricarboxylate transporter receptor subunit TctC [Enterovirga rhinocerotis]